MGLGTANAVMMRGALLSTCSQKTALDVPVAASLHCTKSLNKEFSRVIWSKTVFVCVNPFVVSNWLSEANEPGGGTIWLLQYLHSAKLSVSTESGKESVLLTPNSGWLSVMTGG